MRRGLAVLAWLGGTTIAGCKVGPRYTPEPVSPPNERSAAVPSSDSTRQFVDSLAVERTRDSVPVLAPNAPRSTLNAAAATAAALCAGRAAGMYRSVTRTVESTRSPRPSSARPAIW